MLHEFREYAPFERFRLHREIDSTSMTMSSPLEQYVYVRID